MNPQTRNALIFWGVLIAIGAAIGGYFGIDYLIKSNKVKPFNSRIAEYTGSFSRPVGQPPDIRPGVPNAFPPGGASDIAGGYVTGKVVPIDMKNNPQVDWIYFEMPVDLKATSPQEVGTVAQLRWREEQIDTYTNGALAMVHICQVDVIDLSKKQVVASRTFRGGEPPMETSSSGKVFGSKPTSDIISYLKSLPRR